MARVGLRNTAALLRQRGWHQGSSQGPNGSICLSHALVLSSPNKEIRTQDREALAKHLGIDPRQIPKWNDAPDRTLAEVLQALEQA